MALSSNFEKILQNRTVKLEQKVGEDLGPLHAKLAQHIFNQVRESIKKMEILYISDFGTFGPNRRKIAKDCNAGRIRSEYQEICSKVQKLSRS